MASLVQGTLRPVRRFKTGIFFPGEVFYAQKSEHFRTWKYAGPPKGKAGLSTTNFQVLLLLVSGRVCGRCVFVLLVVTHLLERRFWAHIWCIWGWKWLFFGTKKSYLQATTTVSNSMVLPAGYIKNATSPASSGSTNLPLFLRWSMAQTFPVLHPLVIQQ